MWQTYLFGHPVNGICHNVADKCDNCDKHIILWHPVNGICHTSVDKCDKHIILGHPVNGTLYILQVAEVGKREHCSRVPWTGRHYFGQYWLYRYCGL